MQSSACGLINITPNPICSLVNTQYATSSTAPERSPCHSTSTVYLIAKSGSLGTAEQREKVSSSQSREATERGTLKGVFSERKSTQKVAVFREGPPQFLHLSVCLSLQRVTAGGGWHTPFDARNSATPAQSRAVIRTVPCTAIGWASLLYLLRFHYQAACSSAQVFL